MPQDEKVTSQTEENEKENVNGGTEHGQENPGQAGDVTPGGSGENPHNGKAGSGKGKGSGGRGSKSRRGRRGDDKKDEASSGSGTDGFTGITIEQYTDRTEKTSLNTEEGMSHAVLSKKAAADTEESIGRAKVVGVIPTNVDLDQGKYVIRKNDLPIRIDEENGPRFSPEDRGQMKGFDTCEELVFIPILPIEASSARNNRYPLNSSAAADGNDKITTEAETTTHKRPIAGQYLGHALMLKHGQITDVYFSDFTPFTDSSVFTSDLYQLTCEEAHYLTEREARVFNDKFTLFEEAKKEGTVKNALYHAPETGKWLMLLKDINLETFRVLCDSIVCANQFMAEINQDRYEYGRLVSRKFKEYKRLLWPILDLTNDAKKFKNSADIPSLMYGKQYVDQAMANVSEYGSWYDYPRTSLLYKKHLQNLFHWSKATNDHRTPANRCIKAASFMFPYSNITQINGVVNTVNGIGGAINRYYTVYEDGLNSRKRAISSPIFDGIQDFLATQTPASTHPWFKADKSAVIPLTYDPKHPQWSFLVCAASGHIIQRLDKMSNDLNKYVSEGGPLPSTVVRPKFEVLKTFIDDSGYGVKNWHDGRKGKTISEVGYNSNLRFRYPETAVLADETTDFDKSSYVYHPGIIQPFTLAMSDDEDASTDALEFTGRLGFPAGRHMCNPLDYCTVLDPIIAINNSSYRDKVYTSTLAASTTGASDSSSWRNAKCSLHTVTLAQICQARRLRGLIYSVPTPLATPDYVDLPYGDHGIIDTTKWTLLSNHAEVMATVLPTVDWSKACSTFKEGMQLSTYRMSFKVIIDDYTAAQVSVGNQQASDTYLSACIALPFTQAGINSTDGYAGRYVSVGSNKKATTNLKPVNLVRFPFKPSELTLAKGVYAEAHMWTFHAAILKFYRNPFFRVREEEKTGEDAPQWVVPHQLATNDIYYWVELDASESLEADRSFMNSHIDALESMFYGSTGNATK